MTPTPDALFTAMEATWPPARRIALNPFVLRDGQGGGQRVSAATADGPVGPGDIDAAAMAMRAMGQAALFRLDEAGGDLDAQLADAGYRMADPTLARCCPIARLCDAPLPPVSGFTIWQPLQIMRDIWAEAGIGPARLAVMARAPGPKTALLGRTDDKPSGVGFVALHDGIAMVHALEVRAAFRRRGTAGHLMRHAARWADTQGAHTMAVLVTEANTGASAFYETLGMDVHARYHYRIKGDET
ncbi:GNAT family N-acetyltransferase [Oceaniglobus indicus]|uniref:GNAT family N-acetyltransferase n=1 Tax=Oceaniglobus indicus TaxID=2047749 RepID=UPI000C18E698|nr:GNAT family N-acetyltransferase [Oceaniglobus indicus]